MNLDVLLLKAFMDLDKFKRLYNSVPEEALAPTTNIFLKYYKLYAKTYPDAKRIDLDALYTLVSITAKNVKPEQLAVVKHQIQQIQKPIDQKLLDGAIDKLVELDAVGRAGGILSQYNAGGEVDPLYELGVILEEAKQQVKLGEDSFCSEDIHSILEDEATDSGLIFPWSMLQESVKGLQSGANIALAGNVGQGKTSVTAQIATHFAKQSAEFYGERPILWVCNEGSVRRIKPRLYSAALKMTSKEMWALDPEDLRKKYCEAIGHDDPDFILLKQFQGGTVQQLEKLIQQTNPFMVITDMTAGLGGVKSEKEHEKLEKVFQIMRDYAINYDLIHMGTLQVSFEGYENLFPPMTAIKGSKIGIQGAMDLIIMMGSITTDPSLDKIRGLSIVKSKYPKEGGTVHPRGEFLFNAPISRLEEMQ